MTVVVFDIDGTLADTRPLVVEAYRRVGVLMPSNAWGVPWRNWLPALAGEDCEAVHAAKNEEYMRILQRESPRPLPSCTLAAELGFHPVRPIAVAFVTGSSRRAADAVLRAIRLPPGWLVGSEMTPTEKARLMTLLQPGAVLVDDDHEVLAIARRVRQDMNFAVIAAGSPNVREAVLTCIR